MTRRPRLAPAVFIVGLMVTPAADAADAPRPQAAGAPVSFLHDVRPILVKHCYACHGPDDKQRKADLRLDTRDGAFADLDGRHPFVPGSPESSEALRRVTQAERKGRMPPGDDDRRLSPAQVDVLRRWIAQGAKWETHWSFVTPVRPALPAVKNASWPRNPIDHFVLARLEKEGLAPSPEADRRTLLRRVCLDLTGLPPTPAQVDEFLADPRPDAYERLVDRLLASPAYGERWARMWLDLARYADTKGYEKDLRRNIWRYRDWVIDAFNRDLPYDRFTTDQLAGDLLPGATPDQLLATAFHRNTLTNDEGGTDDEEFRVAAVKDRIDTTVQVWMGLTMGCAKCHSHKYDPISLKEYYRFYALFNQTEDADRFDDAPLAALPGPEHQARLDALNADIQRLEASLREETPARRQAFARWEESQRRRKNWTVPRPVTLAAVAGTTLTRQPDESVLAAGPPPKYETYTVTLPVPLERLAALRLEALPDKSLPKGGPGRSVNDGNFVLTGLALTLRTKDGQTRELKPARAEADFAQDNYPVAHVLANPDPKKHGWAISPRQNQPHRAVFTLAEPAPVPPGSELVVRLDHQFEFAYPGFSLGRFRLALSDDPAASVQDDLPPAVAAALAVPADRRTEEQRRHLWKHFTDSAPEAKSIRDQISQRKAAAEAVLASVRTPVLRELPPDKRRVTKLHKRGNFLEQGEEVQPGTPESFPPLPPDAPRNRLGAARWLADPANPLTARVAVNRHWAHFFGKGLVETQEDFGSQGQPPSHPELLDWLAVDLRDGGWSLKALCRRIVTSATYRQDSRVRPEAAARDRTNRLLVRGPRFRMEAEMIRDTALAAAGLISRKMHGPSVMPYQPEGIWKSTYSTDSWITSPGQDRHRRGLYTFVKRTSPYPAMTTFDAPSRELCTVRRIATNTPLQALVTLNDAVFVEAAQALARRAAREAGPDVRARVARALELALVRPATPREVDALAALYERRLAVGRADPAAALRLATEPLGPLPAGADAADLAALSAVCNVLLNLDEFLTRG